MCLPYYSNNPGRKGMKIILIDVLPDCWQQRKVVHSGVHVSDYWHSDGNLVTDGSVFPFEVFNLRVNLSFNSRHFSRSFSGSLLRLGLLLFGKDFQLPTTFAFNRQRKNMERNVSKISNITPASAQWTTLV